MNAGLYNITGHKKVRCIEISQRKTHMSIQKLRFDRSAVKQRVFIVGCSRSGTTLLQTLLASHEEATTFPETQFFPTMMRGRLPYPRVLTRLGLATGKEIDYLKRMLKRFGREELIPLIPRQPWMVKDSIEIYISLLDFIAANMKKKIWIEKTPLNILWIEMIEEYVPSPIVIHMIRDGRDVVASIIDRCRENPEVFEGQDVEYATRLWNQCMRKTKGHIFKENHFLVEYSDLTQNTIEVVNRVGSAIGLNYEQIDIQNRHKVIESAVLDSESWKSNVSRSVEKKSKFSSVFSDRERVKIEKGLDMSIYEDLSSKSVEQW